MGSILETVMLVCFGFSWPLNVIKAYRAKTAKGTSLPFILLIIAGYIAGISAKLITPVTTLLLIMNGGTQYVNPRLIMKSLA